ncbi:DUF6020 family protein [Nocardioides sp.]|uniref:DUF6020 family protein n=1 Tax=Nocardioides sp. TaxID=35761 RepID=UPI0035193B92
MVPEEQRPSPDPAPTPIATPTPTGVVARVLPPLVRVALIGVVGAAVAAGFLGRLLTPDDAPYLLVTREVDDHPLAATAIVALSLAAVAVLLRAAERLVSGWRDGARATAAITPRGRRWRRRTDHVYARWGRLAVVLVLMWLPWYLTSFPGQPSPDAANMITEFLDTRADFADTPPLAPADLTSPLEDYPTSDYLLTDSDRLWSNHHPFFLMLTYGGISAASVALFDSLVPGLVLISGLSAALTVVAFARALWLLGRRVRGWRVRLLALVGLGVTPLIPLWSMAEHKNQLFCAAFVWWLALTAQLLDRADRTAPTGPTAGARAPIAPGRGWYLETTAASLIMAISVQFGWIVLAAQSVALLVVLRRRATPVLAMALPALAVMGSISALGTAGVVVPSDPIETKGLQLQTMALLLREHPEDAFTAAERADLERLFDLDVAAAVFDPDNADPIKSTGPLDKKSASFRYRTVRAEDWEPFDGIILAAAARHPGTALDALFLKSYRYLDPFDRGTDFYPPWNPDYDRTVSGHRAAPMPLNDVSRGAVRAVANGCHSVAVCRPLVSPGPPTLLVVLLLGAGVVVRRRRAWLWALPFALQLGIAGVSPLSAGGRYVLAAVYGATIVVLLLAAPDRPDAQEPDGPEEPHAEPDRAPVVKRAQAASVRARENTQR